MATEKDMTIKEIIKYPHIWLMLFCASALTILVTTGFNWFMGIETNNNANCQTEKAALRQDLINERKRSDTALSMYNAEHALRMQQQQDAKNAAIIDSIVRTKLEERTKTILNNANN